MSATTLAPPASLRDLLGLFTGDEDTEPCPSVKLARRICEVAQPDSPTALKQLLYGDWPNDAIPLAEREAICVAWWQWCNAGKPARP